MKSVLKSILISFVFSAVGMCWLRTYYSKETETGYCLG
ncbi:DUF3902 family protein [Bacillus cereus]